MSRSIEGRHVLEGTLRALTPLHVGAAAHGDVTDRVVLRDGLGRPVVPGTSLAGALRAALRTWESTDPHPAGTLDSDELWGWSRGEDGGASTVLVDDAPATSATTVLPVRQHVALERVHATAAQGLLFTQEVLPAGTELALRIEVEVPDGGAARAAALVERIVHLLTRSGLRVGASGGSGLGRVALADAVLRAEDWTSPGGLRATLTGTTPARAVHGPATVADLAPDPWSVVIEVPWEPLGAVVSGTAVEAGPVSDVPLLTPGPAGLLHGTLPGSSIRGTLASHVERLARTLAGEPAPSLADGRGTVFAAQIAQRGSLPGVAALLGLAGAESESEEPGRAGALAVHDCRTRDGIDAAEWTAALAVPRTANPETDLQLFRKQLPVGYTVVPHVAIDRWTGAAARLFHVVEPERGQAWESLRLEVDTAALGAEAAAAWALLLAALRDLADGGVPLGGRTTRGCGALRADHTRITFTAGSSVSGESVSGLISRGGTLAAVIANTALAEQLDAAARPAAEVAR